MVVHIFIFNFFVAREKSVFELEETRKFEIQRKCSPPLLSVTVRNFSSFDSNLS